MTHLRQRMLEELQRRNYSDATIRHYLHFVEEFARHFGKSPDKLGLDQLRSYQAYLLKQRKLAAGTVENHVSALRFFFVRTLHRPEFREFIPFPRAQRRLPHILSKEEVARLIQRQPEPFPANSAYGSLRQRGMRRYAEVARLKLSHIPTSQRMDHPRGRRQGGKDRDLRP